jgi:hypothetical protein
MTINQAPLTASSARIADEIKIPKQTASYYVAILAEERQGKTLPATTLRLMAPCPEALGRSMGELLKRRFGVMREDAAQSIPRLKIIMVELENSYLVIRLESPCNQLGSLRSTDPQLRAFSQFFRGLTATLSLPPPSPIIRRRKIDCSRS